MAKKKKSPSIYVVGGPPNSVGDIFIDNDVTMSLEHAMHVGEGRIEDEGTAIVYKLVPVKNGVKNAVQWVDIGHKCGCSGKCKSSRG
jgi:hypothetical protein